MLRNGVGHWVIRCVQIALAAFVCASPCHAALTYNYDGRWLLDSQTSLYWQLLPIPASTFIPPYGQIASGAQVGELAQHAGVVFGDITPAPYSTDIANYMSFFAANTPALAPEEQSDLAKFGVYVPQPERPDLGYEYFFETYRAATSDRSLWTYFVTTTIGSYGPGRSCGNFPDCPDSVLAFVVSTTQPVPLPAALWLFLSGIAGLRVTSEVASRRRAAA
jgi:hypothetical protein